MTRRDAFITIDRKHAEILRTISERYMDGEIERDARDALADTEHARYMRELRAADKRRPFRG